LVYKDVDVNQPSLGQSGFIGEKVAELKEAIEAFCAGLTLERQQKHLPMQLVDEVCGMIHGPEYVKEGVVDRRIVDTVRDFFALVSVQGTVTAKEILASDILKVVVCNTEIGHVVSDYINIVAISY